jgi:hypothetical protein
MQRPDGAERRMSAKAEVVGRRHTAEFGRLLSVIRGATSETGKVGFTSSFRDDRLGSITASIALFRLQLRDGNAMVRYRSFPTMLLSLKPVDRLLLSAGFERHCGAMRKTGRARILGYPVYISYQEISVIAHTGLAHS